MASRLERAVALIHEGLSRRAIERVLRGEFGGKAIGTHTYQRLYREGKASTQQPTRPPTRRQPAPVIEVPIAPPLEPAPRLRRPPRYERPTPKPPPVEITPDLRNAVLERAKQLMVSQPDWGRRILNAHLRAEFGVGLRDSTVDGLSRELMRPTVWLRMITSSAFLPDEKPVLRQFLAQGDSRPYLRDTIAARMREYYDARQMGVPPGQYHADIRRLYHNHGWLVPQSATERRPGDLDPFAMLRYYRDRSIDKGDYVPLGRPRRSPFSRGDVAAQKHRRQERQRQAATTDQRRPSGDTREWLRQLDKAIAAAATPERRRELEIQRDNLRRL